MLFINFYLFFILNSFIFELIVVWSGWVYDPSSILKQYFRKY